ncbi:MAG: MFS transporter [Candidatus Roseilinea sp.]|nr:MAG: MFS transporter [Candidatus Roseilinea sp.]
MATSTAVPAGSAARPTIRLAPAIASLVLLRGAMDAAYRAPLPFLVYIAAAFGADPAQAGWLAVALSAAGLVAPIVGPLEGWLGRRMTTVVASGAFIGVCMIMPFAPSYSAVLSLYLALGVAKALFTPQVQAFIGDAVPYERRGAAIGFVELSWALGWIIGVPVFGLLIEWATWWAPFIAFGLTGMAGLALVLHFAIVRDATPCGRATPRFDLGSMRRVWTTPAAVLVLAFGLLISFSSQLATLAYAPWLIAQFGLTPAQLGLISIVLGVADVVAEVGVIVLVDRIGKRRSVLAATTLYAAAFVLVIAFSRSLGPLMAALFLLFLTFEYALVASLAVASEATPGARAAMGGFVVATYSIGRIVASLIALPLFGLAGLGGVMTVAAVSTVMAVGAFWFVQVKEKAPAQR